LLFDWRFTAGKLEDGTPFDSSYDRGTPFDLTLGAGMVISGTFNVAVRMAQFDLLGGGWQYCTAVFRLLGYVLLVGDVLFSVTEVLVFPRGGVQDQLCFSGKR